MNRKVLFSKEDSDKIKSFIIEHNMFFDDGKHGVPWEHWNKVAESQIKYLENNTKGISTCPLCERICVGVDENGVDWCIKCDWRK